MPSSKRSKRGVWERTRKQVLAMYGNVCAVCGEIANEVDHILELDAGGDDSLDNLQVLCTYHHRIKTAQYNSKRMTKANGVFLRPIAPSTLTSLSLSPMRRFEPPMTGSVQK